MIVILAGLRAVIGAVAGVVAVVADAVQAGVTVAVAGGVRRAVTVAGIGADSGHAGSTRVVDAAVEGEEDEGAKGECVSTGQGRSVWMHVGILNQAGGISLWGVTLPWEEGHPWRSGRFIDGEGG